MGLQLVFLVGNFFSGLGYAVLAPMILGRTGNNELIFINGSNQAIWQAKVAPDVQGRVFTTRTFIARLVLPLSQLLAGPLADRVLEPTMAGLGGYLFPTVRNAEDILPDPDAVVAEV